jgi:hypothetical protein
MDLTVDTLDFDESRSTSDDSGYEETTCSTASVQSRIFAYEKEHGCSYHAYHAGKYMVPIDEGEQEGMDIHYHALRLSIGNKLFHAPIGAPTAIMGDECGWRVSGGGGNRFRFITDSADLCPS